MDETTRTAPLQVIRHGGSTIGRTLVHEKVFDFLGVSFIQDTLLYPELDEVLARFDRSFGGCGDIIKLVLTSEKRERVIPECIGFYADHREGRFMAESGRAMPVDGMVRSRSIDFRQF